MNNLKKKNRNKIKKNDLVSFQSDIVIDEDGEISISFFGPDILHLLNRKVKFYANREWKLPVYHEEDFHDEMKSIQEEYSNCMLCPLECGFNRFLNSHFNCGDWHLKVSNFGISFGDEREISDGGGSGLIFLNGCHLTCPSCINEEKVREDRSETTIIDFLKMCETLYLRGANNVQILSPTISFPHLRLALQVLKKHLFPIPIILKSSGYESVAELRKLHGLIDIYIPDYKFMNSLFWQKRSGAKNYHENFIKCLQEMYRQVGKVETSAEGIILKGVIIRHVLNPYIKGNEKRLILDYLNSHANDMHISILDNFVVLE